MPRIDVVVESPVSSSSRARQLEGMFDVPRVEHSRMEWHGDVLLDAKPWNVGLIVGPSGSGKSTIARQLFGHAVDVPMSWRGVSVVDDFAPSYSMQDVANVCQAVGFNTIPAWLRPFQVLSTGERFRVELARRLLELGDPIVVDEFTSVVDRQVAKIGAHAVQKYVRRNKRQFVGVTCHYDVLDWLQPDWILEPANMTLTWRSLQRRPRIEAVISPVPYAAWEMFAPFHYLTASLNRTARCFGLFVENKPVAFTSILNRPHPRVSDIMGFSRTVVLPDWQGLGLAFILRECVAGLYRAIGKRVHSYPSHPSFIRAMDKSAAWCLRKRPMMTEKTPSRSGLGQFGGRANAVFSYEGPAASIAEARRVLSYWDKKVKVARDTLPAGVLVHDRV